MRLSYGEPHTWTSLAARSRKSGSAPVGMTRGEMALPGRVVAEQEPFFIALGGPWPMIPLSKNISKKGPSKRRSLHCAALRSR